MSQNSSIEWTEATWNPVRGCTKVSPGCAHCYAETFAERWRGVPGHAYEQGFDLRLVPEKADEPLRRKKPTTYFVNSMSDLFQDGVPDDFIDGVFAVMYLARRHTFQVLTKRAERMRRYMSDSTLPARIDAQLLKGVASGWDSAVCLVQRNGVEGWPLPNVWLGVSVENQHFADERIPLLLQTSAAVRFISAEPLLAPIRIFSDANDPAVGILDWVIVGGESGPGARPFDVEWARSIIAQCQAAGVACFVKQLGRDLSVRKAAKGNDMAEWPIDLRVRQMPQRIR